MVAYDKSKDVYGYLFYSSSLASPNGIYYVDLSNYKNQNITYVDPSPGGVVQLAYGNGFIYGLYSPGFCLGGPGCTGSKLVVVYPNLTGLTQLDTSQTYNLPDGNTDNSFSLAYDSNSKDIYVTQFANQIPYPGNVTIVSFDSFGNVNNMKSLPVGLDPHGLVVDTSDGYVFVADEKSQSITAIEDASNEVSFNIPLEIFVNGMAFDPNYGNIYATESNQNQLADIYNNTVVDTSNTSMWPIAVTVDPNDGLVYVSNGFSGTINVYNDSNDNIVGSISLGGNVFVSSNIAYDQYNGYVYATNSSVFCWTVGDSYDSSCFQGNSILVINPLTNKITTSIPVNGFPEGTAVNPSNGLLYVASAGFCYFDYYHDQEVCQPSSVSVINSTTNSVVQTINTGYWSDQPAYDPVNNYLYVPNLISNTVTIIDVSTNQVVKTVPVGVGPGSVVIDTENGFAYVMNQVSSTISVIDGTQVISTIQAGSYPYDGVFDPYDGNIYVSNYYSGSISIISPSISLHDVTFTEGGDVPGQSFWSVTVDNATAVASFPSCATIETCQSSISFALTNGVYTYSVGMGTGPEPNTAKSTFTVNSNDITIPVEFYYIPVVETGLPNGTSWSAMLNGVYLNSTMLDSSTGAQYGSNLYFYEPNGTYPLSISTVTLGSNNQTIYVPVQFNATVRESGNTLSLVGNDNRLQIVDRELEVSFVPAVPVSIMIYPAAGSSALSPNNYFYITYQLGGYSYSTLYTGGTQSLYVNSSSYLTIYGKSSASNSSEEWCLDSYCSDLNINSQNGGSISLVYYDLFSQSVSDYIIGGGSPTIALSYETAPQTSGSTDSGLETSISLSPSVQTIWILRGTVASVPSSVSGTSGQRWAAPPSENVSWTVSSSGQISSSITYYHQYQVSFSYSIIGGGSPSAPTVDYISFGAPQSITLTQATTSFWADSVSSWSVTNPLRGSTNSERWYTNAATSGKISSDTTITLSYYHQFAFNASYSLFEGGTPTAPILTSTQFGSGYVSKLTTIPEVYWFDSGSSWTLTNPLVGSTSTERWYTNAPAYGVVSGPESLGFVYYKQYLVQISSLGSGSTTPSGTSWYNASSVIRLTANSNANYTFAFWDDNSSRITISNSSSDAIQAVINGPGTIEAVFEIASASSVSVVSSTVSNGEAYSNQTSTTGVSVLITGSSASNGTIVQVETQDLTAPTNGTGSLQLSNAEYYDVYVSGLSSGNAEICVGDPSASTSIVMEYWNGTAWVEASGITVGGTRVCGNIPVSYLTGTNIAVGNAPSASCSLTATSSGSTSCSSSATTSSSSASTTKSSSSKIPIVPGGGAMSVLESIIALMSVIIMVIVGGLFAVVRRRRRRGIAK